jgi:hypothetical protein
MRKVSFFHGGMAFLAAVVFAAPATAQYSCSSPTTNEWLTKGDHPSPEAQLSDERVLPVTQRVPEAIAKLESRSAIRLGETEVRHFTEESSARISNHKLRAYLVRAVFPTPHPRFWVKWDGVRLDVFAGGLGCAPFTKHPIIVLLERRPREVYVGASAAL